MIARCVLLVALLCSVLTAQAEATQIWMVGSPRIDNVVRHAVVDAPDMFAPNAPWQTVAAHTAVVKFTPGNVLMAKDDALREAFGDVKRRGMALALEAGLLTKTDQCQQRSEAYLDSVDTLRRLVDKIHRTGGDLRYIAMDEPFFYGHDYDGPTACHESAAALASRIVANARVVRDVFPQVQIGDIEVVGPNRAHTDELSGWADAYRAAAGVPFAFLHTDVDWSDAAMRNLVPLAAAMRQRNVPFGIIYNADADALTDAAWTQSALDHITFIESVLGLHPDEAIFQTWVRNPTHLLPETQAGTLSNVAYQYLHAAPSLTLARSGDAVAGRLTDAHGAPIANAPVALTAIDANARMGLTDRTLTGTVPAKAASVVVGIRSDLEASCVCDGPATVTVNTIHYREPTTGRTRDVRPGPALMPGVDVAVAATRTLRLTQGTPYAPNLRQFPVTAGVPFTLDVAMRATANAETAGYVTLIFFDAAGTGLGRTMLWFRPSHRDLGSAVTDRTGRFSLALPSDVLYAGGAVRAAYAGSATARPTEMRLAVAGADDPVPVAGPNAKLVWLGPRGDFREALESDAAWNAAAPQWRDAARHVNVVAFSTQFMQAVSDDDLATIVRHLREKHIALGIEALAQNWYHETPCGQGFEGYSDPGSSNGIAAKLMRVGARLDYIRMDGPLASGHYADGARACKSSIPEVARRAQVIIGMYTAAFPNVVVGDAEPFPMISGHAGWQADWAAWLAAFRAATKTPVAFVHLDFNWGDPRLRDPAATVALARSTAAVARANGQQVGIFVNGTGGRNTDAGWMAQARLHADAIAASGIDPDHLLFGSWDPWPTRILPESDPDAVMSLVDYWFRVNR